MNRTNKQQGFSLIELMIVVVIIGVLSAVAIPQYQDYVAKSELGAGLASITSLRTNVENYVVMEGAFPDGSTAKQKPEDLGAVQPNNATISFDGKTNNIILTFDSTGNSPEVNTKKITLVRSTKGEWTCKSDVTENLLPKGCTKI